MTLAGLSYAIGLGVYLGVVISVAFLIFLLTIADVWLLYLLIRLCVTRLTIRPTKTLRISGNICKKATTSNKS